MYVHLLMEVYSRADVTTHQYSYSKVVVGVYKNVAAAKKKQVEMEKDNVSYKYHIETKHLNEE